ncbi:MAG: tectonin domain-containing protein [Pseudomonadota bacterium]
MGTRFRSANTVWRSLLVLTVFIIGALANASDAKTQSLTITSGPPAEEGHVICGAMDLKTGKLMPPCGFDKATKTRNAVGECPRGSFFDIGTWSCFSCPSGYNRTGFAVDTPQACSKTVSAEYKSATRVGPHKSCPAGSFKDLRNGGECWSCPAGFDRTLSAVNEWDACGKIFEPARRAEFIDRVCPEGSFPDLNGSCYTCPDGYRRTAAAVSAHNACFRNESLVAAEKITALTCKAGEHFDFIDGGTCWSCPVNSVRSVYGVKTDQACEYLTMRWEPARRTPNGLFGLPGAHEIVAEVIKDRTLIDEGITNYISAAGLNKAKTDELKAEAWNLILTEPEESVILKAAVYVHVFNVIKRGPKTKPERDLLNYMALYVQKSRLLVAKEMQSVWQSWERGLKVVRPGMSDGLNPNDIGVRPPQMEDQVGDIMLLAPGAAVVVAYAGLGAATLVSTSVAKAVGTVGQAIFPYLVEGIEQTTRIVATTSNVASTSMAFMAPTMIILTASSIVASIGTDIALDQIKQESIITDALANSKKPVNLSRLLLTDNGRTEVLMNWGLMTQESIKPQVQTWAKLMGTDKKSYGPAIDMTVEGDRVDIGEPTQQTIELTQIESISIDASAGRAVKWDLVPGEATDVAIGTDGTTYVIGMTKAGGGYEIFKRAKTAKRWTKMSGAATRLAVSDNEAWVVNETGQIFSQSGSKWRRIPGPAAQDIGASAKGIWITAVDGSIHVRDGNRWQKLPGTAKRIDIDQNGRPWVVNENGNIFVHDNNKKWEKLPGSAVDIAVDIPGAALIVGTDGKTYLFNATKRDWDPISQDTDSSTIGAGGGQVWRLTKKNEIYQMN